jgi:2-polyprenyl-3-methyl-5-hydroxy-6-metoxy-1,4-benzoquinol methylase
MENQHNLQKMLVACPCCGNSNLQESNVNAAEGNLLICNRCQQLISQCTKEKYATTMRQFDQEGVTLPKGRSIQRALKVHGKRLALIRKHCNYLPAHAIKLLDVGCSSGSFLLSAKSFGFMQAEGVEPAAKAVATAKSLGLKVSSGYLEDINFSDNSFDAITLFEVIEHLENPNQLLTECCRILKPEGILMIGTGNTSSWTVRAMQGRWEYFDMERHGGHISFFNPSSIAKIACTNKFQVAEIKTRCVQFYNKADRVNIVVKKITKLFTELLNIPAQIFGKGHDMLAVLRKI